MPDGRPSGNVARLIALAGFFVCLLSWGATAAAEPYLAVRQGLACSGCHVNPTGGGLRNLAGNAFAQNELAARPIDTGDTQWLGELNRFVSLGGDFRGLATYTDFPKGQDEDLAFEVGDLRAYLDVHVIPDRLSIYVDQKLGPEESRNLEAYARLWIDRSNRYYVKAGQMYLPFGFRLEDDSAFIREVSGISYDTPDDGVEFGYQSGPWNAQLAVTNGSAGGGESNSGKQWSLRGEHVSSAWRVGASYNFNDSGTTERQMSALHAGVRTGPVAWLAEVDYIEDVDLPGGDLRRWVGLVEADWMPRRGHNLKATYEAIRQHSDLDVADQERYSLVYEYFPIQFLELRGGVRFYDGAANDDFQNRTFGFIELHGYF